MNIKEKAEEYYQEFWSIIARVVNRKNEPKFFSYNEMIEFASDFMKEQRYQDSKRIKSNPNEIKSYREIFWKYRLEMLKSMKTCYLNSDVKYDDKEMEKRFKNLTKSLVDYDVDWIGFKNL